MKKLNKNGFTLVELLAVIVVLAVIMLLAVNAVIPQMNKARKNAFKTEIQSYFTGAETWYNNQLLAGTTVNDGDCVKFDTLEGEYVSAKDDDKLTGYIEFDITDGKVSYKVSVSNGEYSFTGKTPSEVADGSFDATNATPTIPASCK